MQLDPCITENIGRRRVFWTTQAAACGDYVSCGVICSIPGLEYESNDNGERTIKTTEWLNSLILNILNTKARTDMPCPTPMAVYGHWSESYRDDNMYIGSTLWNAAVKPYARTSDMVKAVTVAIRADMAKLIALGVANSVDVETTYLSGGRVSVVVTVTATTGVRRVNLSGAFVSEGWVWT